MGFAETRQGRLAEVASMQGQIGQLLATQAVNGAVTIRNRALAEAARQELEQTKGNGMPVERIYPEAEVNDIYEFLGEMQQAGFPGSIYFSPPDPEPTPEPAPEPVVESEPDPEPTAQAPNGLKRRVIKFMIDALEDTPRSNGARGEVAASVPEPTPEPAPEPEEEPEPQPEWEACRGYVVGAFNRPVPPHWTSVEGQGPDLAVLLTNGTLAMASSVITSTGRVVPNPRQQPQPVMPDAQGRFELPTHGFFAPVVPDVLRRGEGVEVPEEVASLLERPVAGAVFMRSLKLEDALDAIAEGGTIDRAAIRIGS